MKLSQLPLATVQALSSHLWLGAPYWLVHTQNIPIMEE